MPDSTPKPEKDLQELEELLEPEEGTESEEDLSSLNPTLFRKAVVTATDWTAETILNQLRKGNITLDPKFQRRDAWKPKRKSKFIESIILGLPIPQLVLAERTKLKGSFIVIDGKQRLLSMQQFAGLNPELDKKPLVLEGLSVRKELNGKTYKDLQGDSKLSPHLRAFENQPIRTVVVKNWQNEAVLYTIFHRLNSSSVPLSPQELRQALHPGDFIQFTVNYSETSIGIRKALNLVKPDFRMRDVELLIRYYAFKNFITDYSGNLKAFLDLTCKTLNQTWTTQISKTTKQAKQLERAIDATFKIFGRKNAFRKWDGERFERRFNRAVFDIMVYYFSQNPVVSQTLRPKIISAFKNLCLKNSPFLKSLETTTKSIEATSTRFNLWGRTLKKLRLKIQVSRLKRKNPEK